MMSIPFDIGRFLIRPNRELYGFFVKAKAEPQTLSELASIPAKHNITVLYFTSSRMASHEGSIATLAFLDFTDADITPEMLMEEVKKLKCVEDVKIVNPKVRGFIADTISSHLTIGGNRAIIIRDVGYRGLVARIRDHIGSGAEAILYYLGMEAGIEFGRKHEEVGEMLGLKSPKEIHDNISVSMFNCVGYGLMETIRFQEKPPYALIRVHNCFECELAKRSDRPFSHLVRGMIAGVLTQLFGEKMLVREVKCIAKGDPYCEFEALPKKL